MATSHGYTSSRYFVELDGASAGYRLGASGGEPIAPVAESGPDAAGVIKKELGTVGYEPIVLRVSTGASQQLYEWIAAVPARNQNPHDGAIVFLDYNNREQARLTWTDGLISEVVFPGLDASAKEAAWIGVTIQPRMTTYTRKPGVAQPSFSSQHGQRRFLPANFRVSIDGLPTFSTRVSKVEPISVRQEVQVGEGGADLGAVRVRLVDVNRSAMEGIEVGLGVVERSASDRAVAQAVPIVWGLNVTGRHREALELVERAREPVERVVAEFPISPGWLQVNSNLALFVEGSLEEAAAGMAALALASPDPDLRTQLGLHRGHELGRRLLRESLEREEPHLVQAAAVVEVGDGFDQPGVEQGAHALVPQPPDVHRAPRGEVHDTLEYPARTRHVGAIARHLVRRMLDLGPADGAFFGHLELLLCAAAALLERSQHLRDDFTRAGDVHPVAHADVLGRDEIGVDKIMYSTDYPHGTTTWPNSVWCRNHSLQDVASVDDRKRILMDNAIGLYKLDMDESQIHQSLYRPGPITVGPRPEAPKSASAAGV